MAFILDLSTGIWTDTEAKPEPTRKPGRPPKDSKADGE